MTPNDDGLPANPIDRLDRAVALLRCADAELGEWLGSALRRYLDTGDSLDSSLGLTRSSGGRSALFEYRYRQRNYHLSNALWHLDGNASALAREIKVYETRVPTACKTRTEPAPEWSPVRKEIHAAFRFSITVPGTAEGLRQALLTTK